MKERYCPARIPKTERKQRTPKTSKQYALKEIEKRRAEETTQVFADLEQEEGTNEKVGEKTASARVGTRSIRPNCIHMRN